MSDPADEFVALYVLDVQENPTAYKRHVRDMPHVAAYNIIDGLGDTGIRQMLGDLKKERELIAKAAR